MGKIKLISPLNRVPVMSLRFRLPELSLLTRPRFRPDPERDIFLVTHPRSGTTWISCIAAELLFGRATETLADINYLVPDIHDLPEKSMVPPSRQYVIKSHFPFNAIHGLPAFGAYHRVIYVIRDPRDVMLSYHRYLKYLMDYAGNLKEFAMDWCSGRIWPCSWQEHVNSWLAPRSRTVPFELTVFRYEDFIADPIKQTGRLARLLGIDPKPERIAQIVADTSPESMREKERKGSIHWNPQFNFIGPAKAGNWQNLQTEPESEALFILDNFARETMQHWGYGALVPF